MTVFARLQFNKVVKHVPSFSWVILKQILNFISNTSSFSFLSQLEQTPYWKN